MFFKIYEVSNVILEEFRGTLMKEYFKIEGERMEITEYIVEEIIDPTGLIEGKRYEFRLYVRLEEDDDLYTNDGIGVRTILAVGDGESRLVVAHFFNRATEEVYDFALEKEEQDLLLQFCLNHFNEID